MIYFDNAATTRVSEEAAQIALKTMRELYANPSAAYRFGISISERVEKARSGLADILGIEKENLIFTSCATESNNYAIKGIMNAYKQKGKRLLVSAVEHSSVTKTARQLVTMGYDMETIPVDAKGIVKLIALEELLQKETILVCVQLVNNEIGIIQPIREIADLVHRYHAFLLVDGVQAFCKIPVNILKLGADAFSLSGHKLHAPKGIGALWLAPKIRCTELLHGGGQEDGRRSGTENTAGILALEAASLTCSQNMQKNALHCQAVRDALWEYVEANIPEVRLNTDFSQSAPHILNISFAGIKSEVLLHYLEQCDICVSAGSACGARRNQRNANIILQACGLEEKWTSSCIRFSFCEDNTIAEALYVGEVLKKSVAEIRLLMK